MFKNDNIWCLSFEQVFYLPGKSVTFSDINRTHIYYMYHIISPNSHLISIVMRAPILSLAFLLVGLSLANCQVYDQPPRILDIVQRAFEEIVTVTDVGINDANAQRDIFFKRFEDLATHVGITGPTPAVFQIVYYWFDNFYVYANNATAKVWLAIGKIIQSIHYEIVQLTRCSSPYDLNKLIDDNIGSLHSNVETIRADSKVGIQTIIDSGRNALLRLHQLAVKDCGAHLEKYNKDAIAMTTQVIAKLKAKFNSRTDALRNATLDSLNKLLVNIRELLSNIPTPVARPAISPPICSPPPVIPPPPIC